MTSTLAMGITANLRRVPTDCCSTIFVDCFLNPLFVTHESATLASKRKPKTKSHPPYKTLLLLIIITNNVRLANLGNGTCIPSLSLSLPSKSDCAQKLQLPQNPTTRSATNSPSSKPTTTHEKCKSKIVTKHAQFAISSSSSSSSSSSNSGGISQQIDP
jgi:hypothetical protein